MATYYVDDATGNDADDGLSEANAFKTLAFAAGAIGAGDTVHVKNTNDYTITSAVAWVDAGILVRGYTATPGDGGRFVVKTSTDSIGLFSIGANMVHLDSFELKHQASTRGVGVYTPAANRTAVTLSNFRIEGCTYGVDGDNVANFIFPQMVCHNGEIVDCATVGISGVALTLSDMLIRGCGTAWRSGQAQGTVAMTRVRVYGGTNGLHWNLLSGMAAIDLNDCVVRGCSSHGINMAHTSGNAVLKVENSVIYGNGGYGITGSFAFAHLLRNVAFRSNTSGNYNATYVIAPLLGEITLTADPHTNAAAFDFSLNTTAGGGALLRAGGFDGTWGGAGAFIDVGGVQHEDAGSGGAIYHGAMAGGLLA